MFRNILVPIVLSHQEQGEQSLALAKQMLSDGGKVTVLTVEDPLPEVLLAELPKNYQQDATEKTRRAFHPLLNRQQMNDADLVVKSGHASNTIVDTAHSDGCDLIVIASHKPQFSDILLGSTAASVVRKAKCPVLVTR